MKTEKNKINDLLYPELSYKIIGAVFDVYNNLGWGHNERVYQGALEKVFNDFRLKFNREKYINIEYRGAKIAQKFLDFVVEDKIILELKIASQLGYTHINQVVSYLKAANLKLAIIVYFLRDGVKFRRIINNQV